MKKLRIRILVTILLLGMAGCFAYLIFHSSLLRRIDLIPPDAETETFFELKPGEEWVQPVYAYKAFEQITLFRDQPERECTVDVEILQHQRLIASERTFFASGASETDLPVNGEKGDVIIRIINRGSDTMILPLLSSRYYDIQELTPAKQPLLKLGLSHFSASVPGTLGIVLLLLLALTLTVLWREGAEWNRGKAVLFIFTICLAYLLLFPAWNINDFSAHFATAYSISSRVLGITPVDESNRLMVREADEYEFRYVLTDRSSPYYQPSRRSYDDALELCFQPSNRNRMVPTDYALQALDGYGIWNYIPSVLGILLTRLFSLNLVTAAFLSRLFGIMMYVGGIYFALQRMPSGLLLPVTILSCFPVCAMNLTAISYDALCYTLVLILFACVLSIREKARMMDAASMAACSALLGMAKGGAYLPLVLSVLPLLFGKERRKKAAAACCVLTALLGLAFNYRHLLFRQIRYFQFGFEGSGSYTPEWAFRNPLDYGIMMIRTYLREPNLILDVVGHRLGWNHETVPEIVCVLFLLLLFFAIASENWKREISRPLVQLEKCWLWLPAVLLILFTPVMMLSSTDVGSEIILGIQGRYFLPLLIPACILLRDCLKRRQINTNPPEGLLLSGLGFLTLLSAYYSTLTFLTS